ncbi:MAG: DUF1428 family protein [Hydrogenophaga sp.]|jgi:uncharacterized protein YbaA (DUF1428 family)|nr:DUF1428 family protein [Hydrogenophaga sp.]MDZ4356138.1 DUF1428 family protein [Variovorax sp.]MDP2406187.1 DUF1428 family protein [Hydrogenophaga sp.]MDP3325254.1 DUF1428 family protein [Hydrogenophaga sp.]MDP3886100.1 DUF1428 family protein [Hydrogenophaga sp.]MDZ4175396.1 DUF1428 family protein [Hydrogenophaga sp.]
MSYIDGFVIAVPTGNRQQFIQHAHRVDSAFIDHGALRVVEAWGDDVPEGTDWPFDGKRMVSGGFTRVVTLEQ